MTTLEAVTDTLRCVGGRTALEVATMAEKWPLVRILVQAKANVEVAFASK